VCLNIKYGYQPSICTNCYRTFLLKLIVLFFCWQIKQYTMKRILVTAIFLSISFLNSFSQTSFGGEKIIAQTDANGPQDVMTCDLDGDNDQDIVFAASNGRIAWFENTDGAGSFSSVNVINSNAPGAKALFCADIDNDGDMDILSASTYYGKIAWYENIDGNGNFSDEYIISESAAGAFGVYAADFDGDGDQDVISASSPDDFIVAWYENTDGNGNFSSEKIVAAYPDNFFSINAADIDSDGDQDIITGLLSTIYWYENTDGNATFSSGHIIESNAYNVSSIETIDMDGDADTDIICTYKNGDKIVWFENTDGTGTFSQEKLISGSVDRPQSVHAADIDNDGDPDILAASDGDNRITWYENVDGSGTFGEQKIISTEAAGANSVYTADLDGDGDQDVISASSDDNKIAWYENIDGSGTFGEQIVLTISLKGAWDVFSTDLDGDGDNDVLSAAKGDGQIAWYENTNGNGAFGKQKIISNDSKFVSSVYATDIDNDGDQDVLSAASSQISWHENINGTGEFSEQNIISTSVSGGQCVFAADLDGDGDSDVLSASAYDNKIAWYENTDGEGTFSEQKIISTNIVDAYSVYATDLDGDGDIDVISASSVYNKIVWFENLEGEGNFSSEIIIDNSASSARYVFSEDVDGDGYMDVICAFYNEGKIAWYKNIDGSGTFGEQQIIDTDPSGWAYTVYAADLDEDGDIDILSGFTIAGKIAWYENTDGQGNFSQQNIIHNSVSCYSVMAEDIDNDGDKDVISVNVGDKISWYKNLTNYSSVNQNSSFQIRAYPNPAGDILKIELLGTNNFDNAILTIFDISGKQVYKESHSNTQHQINTSNLKKGMYFIRIQTSGNVYTEKIIIE
jgi:hypothetical protein